MFTNHIFFIHSSVNRHLGYFHALATVNSYVNTVMNIGVLVSFQIIVLSGYMLSSGMAGSHGNSSFSFVRNLPIEPAAAAMVGGRALAGGVRARARCKQGLLLSSVAITTLVGVHYNPRLLKQ